MKYNIAFDWRQSQLHFIFEYDHYKDTKTNIQTAYRSTHSNYDKRWDREKWL